MIDSKKGIQACNQRAARKEARKEARRDASVRVIEINRSNSKEQ
jgi:hypothetical protein